MTQNARGVEQPRATRCALFAENARKNGPPLRESRHLRRTPPISSCMSTPLLLSIHAAMKVSPAQVLPV
jgi:hypothetical protein